MKAQHKFEEVMKKLSFNSILTFYFLLILVFSLLFFILSSSSNGDGIYNGDQRISQGINGYIEALYFSFVTSTSLGYGDITPLGISRLLSIIEVFVSLIIFGVLVSKLLYRKQDMILEELYKVSSQERFTRIISGLYNFRAEIDRIIDQLSIIKKGETDEMLQNIESNLHLLSSYIADSEQMILEFKNTTKTEIMLNNIHSSISKLDELASVLKHKNIDWEKRAIAANLKSILISVEKICEKCAASGYKNIDDVLKEVKRHSNKLKNGI